jgi:hypothetical protein
MMSVNRRSRIWLARHRVDFRKWQSGLLAEAYKMALDPYAGDVVIVIGRNRRRLKILYADPSGLWVSAKLFTLESMKTKLRFLTEPSCNVITQAELALLIEGAAYTIDKQVASYTKPVDTRKELPPASPTT